MPTPRKTNSTQQPKIGTRKDAQIDEATSRELLIDIENNSQASTPAAICNRKPEIYGEPTTSFRKSCSNRFYWYKNLKVNDESKYWKLYVAALEQKSSEEEVSKQQTVDTTIEEEGEEEQDNDEEFELETPSASSTAWKKKTYQHQPKAAAKSKPTKKKEMATSKSSKLPESDYHAVRYVDSAEVNDNVLAANLMIFRITNSEVATAGGVQFYSGYQIRYTGDYKAAMCGEEEMLTAVVLDPLSVLVSYPAVPTSFLEKSAEINIEASKLGIDTSPVSASVDTCVSKMQKNPKLHQLVHVLVKFDNTGETLDNEIFSPGESDGRIVPEVVPFESAFESDEGEEFSTTDLYVSFNIARVEEEERHKKYAKPKSRNPIAAAHALRKATAASVGDSMGTTDDEEEVIDPMEEEPNERAEHHELSMARRRYEQEMNELQTQQQQLREQQVQFDLESSQQERQATALQHQAKELESERQKLLSLSHQKEASSNETLQKIESDQQHINIQLHNLQLQHAAMEQQRVQLESYRLQLEEHERQLSSSTYQSNVANSAGKKRKIAEEEKEESANSQFVPEPTASASTALPAQVSFGPSQVASTSAVELPSQVATSTSAEGSSSAEGSAVTATTASMPESVPSIAEPDNNTWRQIAHELSVPTSQDKRKQKLMELSCTTIDEENDEENGDESNDELNESSD